MSEIIVQHNKAMDLAEIAFIEKRNGNYEKAIDLFAEAFIYERDAALRTQMLSGNEPSRSILFKSAASLAMKSENFREAERMVALGLAGDPPEQIAEELRDLFEQINFERHLALKGITLDENDIQLSLSGKDIGYGVARVEEFTKRLLIFEKLIYRTAERIRGTPFRETGEVKDIIKNDFEQYISVPRAASFAVTVKLGKPYKQLSIVDLTNDVVSEIFNGISLINSNEQELLSEKIANEDYYKNFVALTRQMAPDGERVNLVGLTTMHQGNIQKVALTKKNYDISFTPSQDVKKIELMNQPIEITGRLGFASADNS